MVVWSQCWRRSGLGLPPQSHCRDPSGLRVERAPRRPDRPQLLRQRQPGGRPREGPRQGPRQDAGGLRGAPGEGGSPRRRCNTQPPRWRRCRRCISTCTREQKGARGARRGAARRSEGGRGQGCPQLLRRRVQKEVGGAGEGRGAEEEGRRRQEKGHRGEAQAGGRGPKEVRGGEAPGATEEDGADQARRGGGAQADGGSQAPSRRPAPEARRGQPAAREGGGR
mmetsp:Transcript_149693/g.480652  ORF Transcript_149693/g.480652 Transcript_149693/m.480652 type:complete len:224 (-) Transcript_149693:3078-3749(-)